MGYVLDPLLSSQTQGEPFVSSYPLSEEMSNDNV